MDLGTRPTFGATQRSMGGSHTAVSNIAASCVTATLYVIAFGVFRRTMVVLASSTLLHHHGPSRQGVSTFKNHAMHHQSFLSKSTLLALSVHHSCLCGKTSDYPVRTSQNMNVVGPRSKTSQGFAGVTWVLVMRCRKRELELSMLIFIPSCTALQHNDISVTSNFMISFDSSAFWPVHLTCHMNASDKEHALVSINASSMEQVLQRYPTSFSTICLGPVVRPRM